ncbi:MAG: HD domain-containing protein [Syntrophobacterales bacterium]|nr:MAG: HD domain-containing protein [Syntrophobacterales bacterium]
MATGERRSKAPRNVEEEIRNYKKKVSEVSRRASRLNRSLKQKEREIRELQKAIEKSHEWEKQLLTLTVLSRILNSTLEHRTVRRRAMQAATELMKAEVGSLLLIDEESNRLYFEVALGDKEETVKTFHLEMGEGIAGWVAKHGEPLIVHDTQSDPRFFSEVDRKSKFTTKNVICVPVKVKEKTIGVLEAINKLGGEAFSEDDVAIFQSLADQVAVALDNARLLAEIEGLFFQTAESLADAIEKRDPYTGGHTKRVTTYSLAIGEQLNLESSDMRWLKLAAILHDIGKIGVEDRILRKTDKLDEEEYNQMKQHTLMGAEIIGHIKQLHGIIPGLKYHHEKIDGKGYPEGLADDNIPLIAKIVAVADTFDAMTSDRPYRKPLEKEKACAELRRCCGTQFDRALVDVFIKAIEIGKI